MFQSWLGTGQSLQVGITVCCLVAFVLFGYDQGVFGGILQNENWLHQFGYPDDTLTGIIVSSYNLGCLAGCFLSYFIGDKIGRRRTIWIAMVIVVVGATLQASAFTVGHLIAGRVITGVGTGIKTSTVPMYQSEVCDHKRRGRLVSAEVLFVGVGITTAYWFDFGLSYVGGEIAWRLPIAFQILFALGVIVIVFAIPESPRWLISRDREQEAVDIICALFDRVPTDDYVIAEVNTIKQAVAMERNEMDESALNLFKKDAIRTRYRIFLAWLTQFMNQVGGINLVVYYIPTVLVQNVGLTPFLAQILGGLINFMFLVGSILPALALDQMGRRKTMMLGCFGLAISMVMVAALLSQADSVTSRGRAFGHGATAFFFVYTLIFGMSANCVPWTYVPELLPQAVRARGTAIGTSSNWLWNFVVVMITPIVVGRLQWKAYLIFFATNLVFVPLVYFLYPETSGLGLEEIDSIFIGGGDPVKKARMMVKQRKHENGTSLESQNRNEQENEKPAAEMTEQFHA